MNAQEVQKKGIEYCYKRVGNSRSCDSTCPLVGHACIDNDGVFHCKLMGFVEFAKDFNFMLKEIYKNEQKTN